MTGVEDRSGGDDGASPNGEDSSVTLRSTIIPAAETAKHWMKNYRTSIASSTSSMLAGGIVVDCSITSLQRDTDPATVPFGHHQDKHAGVGLFGCYPAYRQVAEADGSNIEEPIPPSENAFEKCIGRMEYGFFGDVSSYPITRPYLPRSVAERSSLDCAYPYCKGRNH